MDKEAAERRKRDHAEAVQAAQAAARLATGKAPVAWQILKLDRLKDRMMEPTEKLEDLSAANSSSTPFMLKLDINPSTPAQERTKLQVTLDAWMGSYKKGNPKYNQSGLTFCELSASQGQADALDIVKAMLTLAKITKNVKSKETTVPYLFGFHETLQHAGMEHFYRATVYMHVSGSIEYVLVNATLRVLLARFPREGDQ